MAAQVDEIRLSAEHVPAGLVIRSRVFASIDAAVGTASSGGVET